MAFVGPAGLLDRCAPHGSTHSFDYRRLAVQPSGGADWSALNVDAFDVMVVLDPAGFRSEDLESLPGITLGVLPELPADGQERACAAVDRLVCFDPALTGRLVGGAEIWRAIPPPVSDAFFAPARPWHRAPRAMTIGHSTSHREAMLMPAKHRHDLLQVIHGVEGAALVDLLGEHGLGVYVSPQSDGGFGWQVGAHLAAGQLLLAEPLRPAHGLEINIDYLRFDSPENLALTLDRLASFPEMFRRIQVRGRSKAEHFRASRIFERIIADVRLDVAAFGSTRAERG